MTTIGIAAEKILGNIDEAEHLEMQAIKLMATDKPLADWFHAMAQEHLKFNLSGHPVIEKMIADAKVAHKDSPMLPGMMARYNADHVKVKVRYAQVKALIDSYGK